MVIIKHVNYDKSGTHESIPPVIALVDCAVVLYCSIKFMDTSLSQCSAIYGQVKIWQTALEISYMQQGFFQAKVLWFIRTL